MNNQPLKAYQERRESHASWSGFEGRSSHPTKAHNTIVEREKTLFKQPHGTCSFLTLPTKLIEVHKKDWPGKGSTVAEYLYM